MLTLEKVLHKKLAESALEKLHDNSESVLEMSQDSALSEEKI